MLVLPVFAALIGCPGGHTLPTATIDVAGHAVVVEVADSASEREKGLMGRKGIPEDEGMLFVYEDEEPRSFWMHDTPTALSIAFADHEGKIVKIADMEPYDEQRTQSLYPAMYALEMNQGWFRTHGVTVGDVMKDLPKADATP